MDNQQNTMNVNEQQMVQQPMQQQVMGQQPMMQQQQMSQVSEEQLRRTYKGIEFRTEEEKNQIEALEKEAAEYCETLENRTYKELFEKNNQWSNLPNAIFMPYKMKVMSEIGGKEAKEIEAYGLRVANASLEELKSLEEEISQQGYSQPALSQVYSAIFERRRNCQVNIFEDMLIGYASLSRNDLKNLRLRITEKNFEVDITNAYVSKIDMQYDIVEQNELQTMCANLDSMGMKELEGALRIISNGGYQEKFSAQYITAINNRIEVLQYQELEALTAAKNSMSKEELQALYQQLEQGGYNPKFLKKFLVDVRMCIDNRCYNEVSAMTANVANSDKMTVANLEKAIEDTGYSAGILYLPRRKIADRKFEFEMSELIDTCNNFDLLTDAEVDNLVAAVKEKGLSPNSFNIYLDKLSQRKFNIALSEVSKLSALFVQMANKYGVGGGDILVASKSDAFLAAFRGLKAAYPASGEYDVPAFIMNGGVSIAISYKYCYLNNGSKQALLDINSINGFKVTKKLFVESLVVELRDGTTVPVSGSINKQMLPAFVQMMNEFLANVNNKIWLDTIPAPMFNVEPLNKEMYSCAMKNYGLSANDLMVISLGAICNSELTREMAKAMHFVGNKDWEQYQMKVKTSYQLAPNENLIFVYDKTLLNSAKEGFALSYDKVFVKKANQPVSVLGMNDIFAVKCDAAGKVYIETTGMIPIYLDMSVSGNCAMFVAGKLDEYVKNMQLCMTLA